MCIPLLQEELEVETRWWVRDGSVEGVGEGGRGGGGRKGWGREGEGEREERRGGREVKGERGTRDLLPMCLHSARWCVHRHSPRAGQTHQNTPASCVEMGGVYGEGWSMWCG